MRVLFVWPNKETSGIKPIGISLLSSIAIQNGYEVGLFETTFIDFGFKTIKETMEENFVFKPIDLSDYNIIKKSVDIEDVLYKKLNSFKPDIIAFSVLSDEVLIAYRLAKIVKRWNKNAINIFGGKYPTVCPEETLSNNFVDFICISEGLEAFPEWLNALERDLDPFNIRNIWSRRKGKIIKTNLRPLKRDLDSLPFLSWDIFDKRDFIKPFDGKVYRGGDLMSNWGCLYDCSYCINKYLHKLHGYSGFVRRYSPERSVQELKYLKEKYQLNFIKFHDEGFLLRDMRNLEEFALLYNKEVGLPFVIETNPLSINEEKAILLKKMNCVSVSVGVESANEHIRKNILKRKENKKDIIKAFQILNDVGIRTVAFLMLGLPFDTRDTIFEAIELMREAKVRVPNLGIFFPFEKTELKEISIKNKFYDPSDVPIYLNDIPALNQPNLSREEVTNLRRVFNFYIKFPYIFWPFIKRAEKNDMIGKEILLILKKIYIEHVRNHGDVFVE